MINPPCASRGGTRPPPPHPSTTTTQHEQQQHQHPSLSPSELKMHYEPNLHRCCRSQQVQEQQPPPDTFTQFRKLPAEIRTMIWELSLPEARVYEVLDAPHANQKTPAQRGLMFANVHAEPPPALAAVCRESRWFVLHHYKPLTLGGVTKHVDLSRDMLLLEPYLLVKRLHRTLHFMSQIPLLRDSVSRLALGTSYGIYTGICHPLLSWRVSKTNMSKLLASLARFPKLRELIFVVHQEFQFEFDFRFPAAGTGTVTPVPKEMGSPYAVSTLGFGGSGMAGNTGSSSSNGRLSGGNSSSSLPLPLNTTVTLPSAARNNNSYPSGYSIPSPISPLPLSPPSSQSSQQQRPTHPQLPSTLLPYPQHPQQTPQPQPQPTHIQQIHQAYRFKFDIEANINHTPHRRPHFNELLYYPLKHIDEDNDDDCWDLNDMLFDQQQQQQQLYADDGGDSGGVNGGMRDTSMQQWCDPWPTNDDWRRFRKRFQRAVNASLEMNGNGVGSGGDGEEGVKRGGGGGGALWNCHPVRELHSRYGHGAAASAWAGRGGNSSNNTNGGAGEGKLPAAAATGAAGAKKFNVPALKGASLLWRYARGGWV